MDFAFDHHPLRAGAAGLAAAFLGASVLAAFAGFLAAGFFSGAFFAFTPCPLVAFFAGVLVLAAVGFFTVSAAVATGLVSLTFVAALGLAFFSALFSCDLTGLAGFPWYGFLMP